MRQVQAVYSSIKQTRKMKISHLTKKEISKGEEVKASDILEEIFNLIK